MLFNSPEFIFLFLPLALLSYFGVAKLGSSGLAKLGSPDVTKSNESIDDYSSRSIARVWLLLLSLGFYGLWNPANLGILVTSIGLNFAIGSAIGRSPKPQSKKMLLIVGIAANLASLIYYKYTNFLLTTSNALLGTDFALQTIALPVGISFFTFIQIAYLIDSYRDPNPPRYGWVEYSSFVGFFPAILSGPLVQHRSMVGQLRHQLNLRPSAPNFAIGLTYFGLGLFKKVVLADSVALYANQVFATAQSGISLDFSEAWIGALAYTLQLYFDFSGYSDMAIGVAKLFGINLPINFNSPYQAIDIIDFWRRWHITLSNFLRDYLYIPLGGNRKGELRRNLNLMLTMLICGLWHGAGWTFVLWGGLHGLYSIINHQWRRWSRDRAFADRWYCRKLAQALTFFAVVVGWVVFRAEQLPVAGSLLQSMAGKNGFAIDFGDLMPNVIVTVEGLADTTRVGEVMPIITILTLLFIVWLLPNTQTWIEAYTQKSDRLDSPLSGSMGKAASQQTAFMRWVPNQFWAVAIAILTVIALLQLSEVSEFLYFEF